MALDMKAVFKRFGEKQIIAKASEMGLPIRVGDPNLLSAANMKKVLAALESEIGTRMSTPLGKAAASTAAAGLGGSPPTVNPSDIFTAGPRPSPTAGAYVGDIPGDKGNWLEKLLGGSEKAAQVTKKAGNVAKFAGVAAILDMLISGALGVAGGVQQTMQEGQMMDAQIAANTGAGATEKAMQPITKAQRDQALMLLMRQLGIQGSNVADGEAWT